MRVKNIFSVGFAVLIGLIATSLLAAPGGPIGGIIVKGGKNPGGQMRVLATTDSGGKFTVNIAEGGEYKLTFESQQASKDFGDRVNAGLELNYTVKTSTSEARHTPFHNKFKGAETIITLPTGGGVISAVLSSTSSTLIVDPAQRSINESGVSVKSEPKKGQK